jgi:hypothetical protein
MALAWNDKPFVVLSVAEGPPTNRPALKDASASVGMTDIPCNGDALTVIKNHFNQAWSFSRPFI